MPLIPRCPTEASLAGLYRTACTALKLRCVAAAVHLLYCESYCAPIQALLSHAAKPLCCHADPAIVGPQYHPLLLLGRSAITGPPYPAVSVKLPLLECTARAVLRSSCTASVLLYMLSYCESYCAPIKLL
jgi:hypothetical protein